MSRKALAVLCKQLWETCIKSLATSQDAFGYYASEAWQLTVRTGAVMAGLFKEVTLFK